uniref:Uncharacterized protein n=1 Tax=Arion vulgaris TaxID=1028688 RepID=A0A0B6ZPP7_9EUPU
MFFIVAVIASVIVYYVIDLVLRSLKVGNITGKHVFITGCDTGFGHLAAIQLDKIGFFVFAGCLTEDGAKLLSEKCSSRLTTVSLNVTSTESVEQAVEVVKEKLPPNTGLWALINNAGIIGLLTPMEFCRKEDIFAVVNVNLLGLIDVTRHFLPLIRKSKGRVVNTASIAGRLAMVPVPYTVSKYGVVGFSDVLRREVCKQGIKVSIVEPGAFMTATANVEKIMTDIQNAFDRHSPDILAVYGGPDLIKKMHDHFDSMSGWCSIKLYLVVDAYVHAITSRFPRIRYVVGTDAKWVFIPMSYLPDFITDFILARAQS